MLLQLAAQSHLIWELNNQPMAKRGKRFTIAQVYAQVARRYVAQNFIVLNNTLTSLLHISCVCFVSSCTSRIPIVASRHRLKNEVGFTFILPLFCLMMVRRTRYITHTLYQTLFSLYTTPDRIQAT